MKLLLIFLCVLPLTLSGVSTQNLEIFFQYTYDKNNDKEVTLEEMTEYFQFMEPSHNLTTTDIKSTFQYFDLNGDGKFLLEELIRLSKISINVDERHKQIHISFTQNPNEIQVIWVSNPEHYQTPVVQWSTYPVIESGFNLNKKTSKATWTTYNVGKIGFHGRIYRAVMSNLEPLKSYYYRVGDIETGTFSQVKKFTSPPNPNTTLDRIDFALFADVGTYAPMGGFVMDLLSKDNIIRGYEFVLLAGDIAYAGMQSQKVGEIEPIWDFFGELSEKFAAYTPFITGLGNHQKYYGYESYFHRYRVPKPFTKINQSSNDSQPNLNLYFSFDYGQLHIAYLSSEHPHDQGSEQYQFLEEDLKRASSNPNTKWIIVSAHRPFYNSNQRQFTNETSLVHDLEDLLINYEVDIVKFGHQHMYERTWPVYKGKRVRQSLVEEEVVEDFGSEKQNQQKEEKENVVLNEKYYINPTTPIYVCQGTGGALISKKYVEPQPEWSAKRLSKHGYGRVRIVGNNLKYEFVTLPGGQVADTWYIVKDREFQSGEREKGAQNESSELILEDQ